MIVGGSRDLRVVGLRETYYEFGTYEFKIILNPKHFQSCHDCEIFLTDSDRRSIDVEVRRWGRKMVCSFVVGSALPDGVVDLKIVLRGQKRERTVKKMFWVIKPDVTK